MSLVGTFFNAPRVEAQLVRDRLEYLPQVRTIVSNPLTWIPSVAESGALLPTSRELTLALKRVFDVSVALVLLFLLLPTMALIALAIRLDSPGPILYRQQRIGKHGQPFAMLKFRSMRPDRRRGVRAIDFPDRRRTLKSDRDPRITRLGRFIRKTSLDELPQLLNILRGEMSFVGPRPELVEMLSYYQPEHYRRHLATPGLTGWWQINGRVTRPTDATPAEDLAIKLTDDSYYVEHQSLLLDLKILLLTVPVAVLGRGAY